MMRREGISNQHRHKVYKLVCLTYNLRWQESTASATQGFQINEIQRLEGEKCRDNVEGVACRRRKNVARVKVKVVLRRESGAKKVQFAATADSTIGNPTSIHGWRARRDVYINFLGSVSFVLDSANQSIAGEFVVRTRKVFLLPNNANMSLIQAGSHLETSPQVTRGDSDKLLTTVFICIFCECERKVILYCRGFAGSPTCYLLYSVIAPTRCQDIIGHTKLLFHVFRFRGALDV
jgi:hypothetical protein